MNKRRYTRNEKVFYTLSLILVASMVVGTIASVFAPAGF
jgi:cell division protein FtsL